MKHRNSNVSNTKLARAVTYLLACISFTAVSQAFGEADSNSRSLPYEYMRKLQLKIQKAWMPPKGNETKRVVVKFVLHKDGTIGEENIRTSSGLSKADDAAFKAIENAAPFAPLPASVSKEKLMIFHFDYNFYTSNFSEERAARERAQTDLAINAAHAFLKKEDYEQSIDVLKTALQANPQNDKVWHELGKVYEAMGDQSNAQQCNAQAFKINPYEYK